MTAARLVEQITYKPGWSFKIGGPLGRFLCIHARTPDSLDPSRVRSTQHMFETPEGLDPQGFHRWCFARVLDAERHEAGEWYRVNGQAPFWPHHQDEGSPHEHVERHIAWH